MAIFLNSNNENKISHVTSTFLIKILMNHTSYLSVILTFDYEKIKVIDSIVGYFFGFMPTSADKLS